LTFASSRTTSPALYSSSVTAKCPLHHHSLSVGSSVPKVSADIHHTRTNFESPHSTPIVMMKRYSAILSLLALSCFATAAILRTIPSAGSALIPREILSPKLFFEDGKVNTGHFTCKVNIVGSHSTCRKTAYIKPQPSAPPGLSQVERQGANNMPGDVLEVHQIRYPGVLALTGPSRRIAAVKKAMSIVST
jgi:predicted small secreted protein